MDTFREESVRRTGMSWSAVFAGTFVFLSIEATFGALAVALFRSGPTAGTLGAGHGVWMIVLSIIALYFGARAAAHLSGEFRRLDGMYCGLVTFGLSIFASVLMAVMIAGNTVRAALPRRDPRPRFALLVQANVRRLMKSDGMRRCMAQEDAHRYVRGCA